VRPTTLLFTLWYTSVQVLGEKLSQSHLSRNVRAGNDAAPRRRGGQSLGPPATLGFRAPARAFPRRRTFPRPHAPHDASKHPRHVFAAGPSPVLPLCAVPRRVPRPWVAQLAGPHLFKAALLSRTRASAESPSPESATVHHGRHRGTPACALLRGRPTPRTPLLGSIEAGATNHHPTLRRHSPDGRPPRPPPGCAADGRRRQHLRPGQPPTPAGGTPWTTPRPLAPDKGRRPRRNFADWAGYRAQGPHCKVWFISRVFCVNRGYGCESAESSADLSEKLYLQ
jgi:hypothetical protein